MFTEECKKVLKITNDSELLKAIQYTIEGGKMTRYHLFKKILEDKDDKNIGFCIELIQAYYITVDDVIDRAEHRRGKICWYKKKGLIGLRDCNKMLSVIFKLIPTETRNLFAKVNYLTCYGQLLDFINSTGKESEYDIELYRRICSYKNGYYTFYLPICSAMILKNQYILSNVSKMCEIAGLLSQMNDDYINFIPFVSEKSEVDVKERKVTWFSVQIMKGSEELKKQFFEGTGKLLKKEILKLMKKYPSDEQKIKQELISISKLETEWILNSILNILGLN